MCNGARPGAEPLAGLAALLGISIGIGMAVPPAPVARAGGLPAPISIGLIEASDPAAGALARGAMAAVAELNAAGGVDGRPLRLVGLAPPRPWRDGAALIARLVVEETVVALIGPADGATAHVAAQIATRERVPVITLSPEDALTRAMDPWVFRGVPADAEQARALLRWALREPHGKRAALVVPAGREGRERLAALEEACRGLGVEVAAVIRPATGGAEPEVGGGSLRIESADVLLVWLDPGPAVAWLRGLEKQRPACPILGSVRLDSREFLSGAPTWAVGLALPRLRADGLAPSGEDRAGSCPEVLPAPDWQDGDGEQALGAALGYDMVRAIAAAARRSGPEPGPIREELAGGCSLRGKTGPFSFDRRGNRRGPIPVGILQDGQVVRASPAVLGEAAVAASAVGPGAPAAVPAERRSTASILSR